MKKIIFPMILFSFSQYSIAQCETFSIPYVLDSENATVPALPDCATSMYQTFSSQEVFKSFAGPVEGFEGKLLAYSTSAEISGVVNSTGASLNSHTIQFEQGTQYVLKYKFKTTALIDFFEVRLRNEDTGNYIPISTEQDVTAQTVTEFTSNTFTVPASGEYRLDLSVTAEANQGMFFIDDITIQQAGVMALDENKFSGIAVYPNPVSDVITINNDYEIDQLKIYALTGQLVYSETVNALVHEVDMNNFLTGVYMLHLYSGGNIKKVKVCKK